MSPTMETTQHLAGYLTREDAVRKCFIERKQGGTIVFTNGVFDILHRGHLEYLKQARELGTILVVGLNTDESTRRIKGDKRPLVSEADRAFALLTLEFVDAVVPFDEDTPAELIKALNPHVLVKGGDYKAENVVGYDHVTQHGGRVEIIPLRDGYSTTAFIQTIVERYR